MVRRTLWDENNNPVEVDLEEPADDADRSPAEWATLREERRNRKAAEEAVANAKAEADTAKRELAFARAGLNLDDPRVADFYKAYDGDLTRDAVTQAAVARGYLQDNGQQPGGDAKAPDVTALAAQQRIVSASAGATPDLRDDTQRLAEAHGQGGTAALIDELRGLGFPIVVEGQT